MRRVVLVAVIFASCFGGGCQKTLGGISIPGLGAARPSDEEQIAMVLNDVQAGLQSRKVFKVLANVSENYRDQDGRNYEGIRSYVQTMMKNYRAVRVTRARPRIVVNGDRARAIEAFGTIAEPFDAGGVPINLQGHVSVYLERTGGVWKIVEWGRLQ